jgi:hypothetical protein
MRPLYYLPGVETLGEFTERFAEAAAGKPIDLVAVVVWRMCERAFADGIEAGSREFEDERAGELGPDL